MVHSAKEVLMVEPARFYSNPQTVDDNAFQLAPPGEGQGSMQVRASLEFAAYRKALEEAGVTVRLYRDYAQNDTPDSIFPNNWFSTHHNSTCVVYPMMAANRRRERRPDIVNDLKQRYSEFIDLTAYEREGKILEGTGSLVLDRINRIAYASLSQRTSPELLAIWAERMNYRPVQFRSFDRFDREIYHTNVMMSIGTGFSAICLDAIHDPAQRAAVIKSLESTGHEILPLTLEQVSHYCGNMIELQSLSGEELLVMSRRAWLNLGDRCKDVLSRHGRIVQSDLGTIEDYGGGSARCMVAELF